MPSFWKRFVRWFPSGIRRLYIWFMNVFQYENVKWKRVLGGLFLLSEGHPGVNTFLFGLNSHYKSVTRRRVRIIYTWRLKVNRNNQEDLWFCLPACRYIYQREIIKGLEIFPQKTYDSNPWFKNCDDTLSDFNQSLVPGQTTAKNTFSATSIVCITKRVP